MSYLLTIDGAERWMVISTSEIDLDHSEHLVWLCRLILSGPFEDNIPPAPGTSSQKDNKTENSNAE